MRAVTIDSDLATLFTFTPRKPPITPIQGVVDYYFPCGRPLTPSLDLSCRFSLASPSAVCTPEQLKHVLKLACPCSRE